MGLIATMSALVLGLLISSAKSSFDLENSGIQQGAANIIQLDRVLAHYGPETKEIRERFRRVVAFRIRLTWPEEGSTPKVTPSASSSPALYSLSKLCWESAGCCSWSRSTQCRQHSWWCSSYGSVCCSSASASLHPATQRFSWPSCSVRWRFPARFF